MRILYGVLLTLVCGVLQAQGVAQRFFETNAVTNTANVGVLVVDVKTGEQVDAYRPDCLHPTASTMKVISTASALELLGSDYRWATYLETDGELVDGVLQGNLYVRGTGDPTLGSSRFDGTAFLSTWVAQLKRAGVQRITGAVVADMSALHPGDAMNEGWTFGDMGNYYGMGVFALNYRDNKMKIVLRSGKVGDAADVVRTEPADPRLQITSYVTCSESLADNSYVHGVAFNYVRTITGEIPAGKGGFAIKGDMPNPGLILAEDLTKALRAGGVPVQEEASYTVELAQEKRTVVYTHLSPALKDVVRETNLHSDNLYAECIFRALTLEAGKRATTVASRQAVKDCWTTRGVPFAPVYQVDGCGLAPENGVAPRTFVEILRYMYNSSSEREAFYESLPVSGVSGTLRTLLNGTPLQGKVHAKSGTIAHVRSYCGYIEVDENTTWAFSVVVHNGNGKAAAVKKAIEQYLLRLTQQK